MSDLSIPCGYCQCGCGEKTQLAPRTHGRLDWVKGKPKPYLNFHGLRPSPARRAEYRKQREAEHPDIPYGYCCCGCGAKVGIARKTDRNWNHFMGEPFYYLPYHYRMRSGEDYKVDPETQCWIWQHPLVPDTGYGQIWEDNQAEQAHHTYYKKRYGRLPEGVHLHHLCERRSCVNPDHLQPLSPQKHRRAHAKLTQEAVDFIRSCRPRGASTREFAERFGVSPTTIRDVLNYKSWKD